MTAEPAPVTLRKGRQPPSLEPTVPQVGLPEIWYWAALREANRVTPVGTSRVSPLRTVSGAERKAFLLPDAASTTALPLPAQLFSADWIRDVSGGVVS